ncbi:MAG: hypothetical protein LM582_04285 [Desulfurococcaceae archaeon]|nr:hypothetical protein [Desulfurococcaceae archaeon]MCC6057500.1 hypothetical protein [Desulfurococcaceae archaeon]
MYRIMFEVYLKGLPTEIECLNKIREILSSSGKCVGSTTAFVCFYRKSVVKVVPKVEESPRRASVPMFPPVYEPIQQAMQLYIVLESEDVENLADVVENLYSLAKGCGLMIKLTG